mgnify:CR=1 FL=1
MSLDAYHKTQVASEEPRETEYRLMGRVTGALMEARDRELKGPELMKALDWNRRMWSAFATDCATNDNSLPQETRAGIISLSLYVSKTCSKVMRGAASIDDLIVINRNIMEGLAQQPGQVQPETGSDTAGQAQTSGSSSGNATYTPSRRPDFLNSGGLVG